MQSGNGNSTELHPVAVDGADLLLAPTTLKALARQGIHSVDDLVLANSRRDEITGIGPRSWGQITDALRVYLGRVGERDTYRGRLMPASHAGEVGLVLTQMMTGQPNANASREEEETMAITSGTARPTRPYARWSRADEDSLLAAGEAAAAGELLGVFRRIADERGLALASVRSKFYVLKRARTTTARPRPNKGVRWSKHLETRLVNDVAKAGPGSTREVFADWARRRGVAESTIKSKYYTVRARENRDGTAAAAAALLPAIAPAPEVAPAPMPPAATATTPPAAATTPPAAAEPVPARVSAPAALSVPPVQPTEGLADLSISELATLACQVNALLEHKIAELQRMWS